MTVFYIFAVESEREIIYSKVELLFGIQFIFMGLILSSSFSLLLGALWTAYILRKTNFNEFRELLANRLNLEFLKKTCRGYKCKIVETSKKVSQKVKGKIKKK
jgi:hypothetical protein